LIELTINNKSKVVSPSKWSEITAKQLIDIELTDKKNVLELFSILLGMELSIVESAKDKRLEEAVFACVAFIFAPPDWEKFKQPSHFNFKGKLYEVPTDFNKMMVGQKVLLSQVAADQESMVANMCKSVAIGMHPVIDDVKIYDAERVDEIEKELMEENGLEVYALSRFFFLHFGHLLRTGKSSLVTFHQHKVQRGKSYRNWLNLKD